MTAILGIDPGLSGGLAWVTEEAAHAVKMPETERDLWDLLGEFQQWGVSHAYIEQVHAMPKQGVTSTFTFGRGVGGLRMALIGRGIPFTEVAPQKWQKALGCLTRGDKNISKRRAQELWPLLKITHKVADALLIAEYGLRALRLQEATT